MAELEIAFRLPLADWPRAVFESDYGYDGGRLLVDGTSVLEARDRGELERGVTARLPGSERSVSLRLVTNANVSDVEARVDGREALREDRMRARPSRSAWAHACLALLGSAAGFVASDLYLLKAARLDSDWALKMGYHMAGWHLLLTFTLFPASVWGQRTGIRLVQLVSGLFFLIHAGIAAANVGAGSGVSAGEYWIAVFNALSGLFFAIAAVYGQRAYRDMNPDVALRDGRVDPARAIRRRGASPTREPA